MTLSIRRELSEDDRERLRRRISVVVRYTPPRRRQAILKKEARLLKPAELRGRAFKKLLEDPESVANVIVTRLEAVPTQHGACVALRKCVQAAWKAESVGQRVRQTFIEASAALRGGRWERLHRLEERLEKLASEEHTKHPLLEHYRDLIAFESGSPQRVFATLDVTPKQAERHGDASNIHEREPSDKQPSSCDKQVSYVTAAPITTRNMGLLHLVAGMKASTSRREASDSVDMGPGPPPDASEHLKLQSPPAPRSVEAALAFLRTLEAKSSAEDPSPKVFTEGLEKFTVSWLDDLAHIETIDDLKEVFDDMTGAIQSRLGQATARVLEVEQQREECGKQLREELAGHEIAALEAAWTESQDRIRAAGLEHLVADIRLGTEQPVALEIQKAISTVARRESEETQRAKSAARQEELLAELATLQGIPIEGLLERIQGKLPAPPPPLARATKSAPLPTEGIAFTEYSATVPEFRGTPGLLGQHVPASVTRPTSVFLPLPDEPGYAAADSSHAARATAAAAVLLDAARKNALHGTVSPTLIVGLITDAQRLAAGGGSSGDTLVQAVLAIAAIATTELRQASTGGRLLRRIAACKSGDEAWDCLLDVMGRACRSAGLPLVLTVALQEGLADTVIQVAKALEQHSETQARSFGEALAVAATGLDDDEAFRERCYAAEGLTTEQRDNLESWLAGFSVRKRRRQPRLSARVSPWLGGFARQRARCSYETDRKGAAAINPSVPKAVAEHGVFVEEGEESIMLPVLVRNAGKAACAGIVVRAKAASTPATHQHVAWLARTELLAPLDAILEFPAVIESDGDHELVLVCSCTWQGGESRGRPLTYRITRERPSISVRRIVGLKGMPVDLTDIDVLSRSSHTVRDEYLSIRSSLREGRPVRRMVYGRRRRGKSSIRSTLRGDAQIQTHFVVESSEWNSARMSRVDEAFFELGDMLRRAIAQRGVSVRPFNAEGVPNRERLYRAWKAWLLEISARLDSELKVLLLIDEFQKWVAALDEQADRQSVLNAFRDFNDEGSGHNLSVSFILFGLRSLQRIARDSVDFANAVSRVELKALTLEESTRYVLETLPVAHDGRTQRRLARLSGGNPFVLNLLCAELTTRVVRQQRPYALVTDVGSMLDDFDGLDSRLGSFFSYMLKQDEDEGSPTLPQLTVLRAVASILHTKGDYSTFVSASAVEAWLAGRNIECEAGLPAEQLAYLADSGVLDRHEDGLRYNVPGEAMCRWLASRSEATAPLQPVTRTPDADLVLNRYRILRELGTGGQGATIWLAEDTTIMGRRVALKIYGGSDLDLRRRVEREARLLARARGRYVVALHDYGFDERKGGVLVMEWVEGRTLRDMLDSPPVSARSLMSGGRPDQQVELMKKLAEGVLRLHQVGIVHKDLTARNVMLVEEAAVWEPRLIDFGISGQYDADARVESDKTCNLGTARYMAPEKLRMGMARSPAADIYSLGVLCVDLTAPRRGGDSPEQELSAAGNVPEGLRKLISEMLSPDPCDRPTAEGVLARLDGALSPENWRDLRSRAFDLHCDSATTLAARLFRRALAEAPKDQHESPEYRALLEECLDCVTECPDEVEWWMSLFKTTISHATSGAEPVAWQHLMSALRAVHDRTSDTELVYGHVLACISDGAVSPGIAGLLRELAEVTVVAERFPDKFHYILVRYHRHDALPAHDLTSFFVEQARSARLLARPITEAELWLRRARRISPSGHDLLAAELLEFDRLREQTQAQQTLPDDSDTFNLVLGKREAGHDKTDRIRAFAENLRAGHPYVACIRRLRKNPRLSASIPRLLGLDSALGDLDGIDPNRVIPFALDPSFSRPSGGNDAVPLTMAIILSEGTTAAQRQAAYERLRDDRALFPA